MSRTRSTSLINLIESQPTWNKGDNIILNVLSRNTEQHIHKTAKECHKINPEFPVIFYRVGLLRAIKDYTREGYLSIKKFLSGPQNLIERQPLYGTTASSISVRLQDKLNARILNYITSTFQLNIPIQVYRGVFDLVQKSIEQLKPEELKNYFQLLAKTIEHKNKFLIGHSLEVGQIISNKVFISTSLFKRVSENFSVVQESDSNTACCLFVIHLPKDFPSLYISHFSAHPEEYELLLASCVDFVITKKEIIDNNQVFHLHPLNPPPLIYAQEAENLNSDEFISRLARDIIYLNQIIDTHVIKSNISLRYDLSCFCTKLCLPENSWVNIISNLSRDKQDIEEVKQQMHFLKPHHDLKIVQLYNKYKNNFYIFRYLISFITIFLSDCKQQKYEDQEITYYLQNIDNLLLALIKKFQDVEKKYSSTIVYFIMEMLNNERTLNKNFYLLLPTHITSYIMIILEELFGYE